MTYEEVKTKYGDVKLEFGFYYKYRFEFFKRIDNLHFHGIVGDGTSESIYRQSIESDETVDLRNFDHVFSRLKIFDADTKKFIFDWTE